jgi:hypothetical protein
VMSNGEIQMSPPRPPFTINGNRFCRWIHRYADDELSLTAHCVNRTVGPFVYGTLPIVPRPRTPARWKTPNGRSVPACVLEHLPTITYVLAFWI